MLRVKALALNKCLLGEMKYIYKVIIESLHEEQN